MTRELDKTYDSKRIEDEIYRRWEESGFFNPDNLPHRSYSLSLKPYTIIMPPPNASGALHIGNAVFVTLQDIMIRFQRMRGRKTLWLPGTDHAGFEAQVVFEKKLEKEGRSRFQIPPDQLFREMWDFAMTNKVVVENQLRKLGASCDWSRNKFTLDPDIVEIVTDTFVKMYEDGLIYRGERIVNWCVKHQTALSDLEVKYEERSDPLYYIRYGPLTLATARPETKFGDTAVAVNPKDKRYQKYIGKELEIETLLGPAKIKVIADEAVDPEFGTGVVKVTPAHDPDDFEIGKRHNLEVRQVIGKDGLLNDKTGPYAGLKVAEAREKVAGDMQARGLMQKIDATYKHNVAVCYKCGNVLEPLVMPQWFLRMTAKPHAQVKNSKLKVKSFGKSLRDMAVEAVKSGKIKFVPKRFEKVFYHWMKNLRDWNISRQITWGIRIPAWFCVGCGEPKINPKIKGDWFFVRHGETDWNVERRIQGHQGASLNERGREQARETARQLEDSNVDLIISSDLARARETAKIIGKELDVEVIFDEALRERRYGVFEGKTSNEVGEESLKKLREYDYTPDGGESLAMLEKRAHDALLRHKNKHRHKNIVIVSHGSALKSLLGKLKNASLDEMKDIIIQNAVPIHFSLTEACKKCGNDLIEQDSDVLDTWFSSGQWPFATLMTTGNPNQKPQTQTKNQKLKTDLDTYYPTDVLETGWDILFFWVARMIMFGLYRTGQVPFRTVYLHGLVRDKDRQKMSKSKGNVIDPLGVAAEYGTDAVRMALTIGNLPGNDIVISEEKIRGYRNFANKLWNIHRFIAMHYNPNLVRLNLARLPAHDQKRLAELRALVKRVTKDMEKFRFHHAAERLYHYAWHTFADKIIESVKPRLSASDIEEKSAAWGLLLEIHSTLLKLLHPFMPFISERLWEHLQEVRDVKKKNLLLIEPWPK